MKKLYLVIAFAWLSSTFASAQLSRRIETGKTHSSLVKQKGNKPSFASRVPSVNHSASIIWSDDFANPSNWTVTHASGTSGDWVIGTTPPSGPYAIAPILSASAANGYALFDSDLSCSTNQIGDLTTTSSIDCSGHSNIRLTFSQYYKHWYDSTYIFISNDGTAWTKYEMNTGLALNDYSGGSISLNPNIVSIDISAVAGNQATVYVKFEFYSPTSLGVNYGCAYSWMIDDVSISDIPSSDVSVLTPSYPGNYSLLPILQTQGFGMSAFIHNTGSTVATNASMLYEVYWDGSNVFTGASDPVATLNPGDTSIALSPTTSYTPSDTGLYLILYVSSLAGDGDGTNDTSFAFVYVSDSMYARDYTAIDVNDYVGGYGYNGGTGAMGLIFDVYQASQFTSSTFYLGDGTIGDEVRVDVYTVASGLPDVLVGSTGTYQMTNLDTGGAFITLPFQSAVNVVPGEYMLAIYQLDTNFFGLGASAGVYTPGKALFQSGAAAWHPVEDADYAFSWILEASNPSSTLVSVPQLDNSSGLIVYPNPTQGIVYLMNNGGTEKNVGITVLDAMGKIVMTRTVSNFMNEKIDLSNQPDGVYTIQVKTSTGLVTKNIVLSGK